MQRERGLRGEQKIREEQQRKRALHLRQQQAGMRRRAALVSCRYGGGCCAGSSPWHSLARDNVNVANRNIQAFPMHIGMLDEVRLRLSS